MKHIPGNILISRTDSIGDTVLTLPVAGALKKYFPDMKIGYLGNAYTRPVIEACKWIDDFIDVQDFMDRTVNICGQAPRSHSARIIPVASIARRCQGNRHSHSYRHDQPL